VERTSDPLGVPRSMIITSSDHSIQHRVRCFDVLVADLQRCGSRPLNSTVSMKAAVGLGCRGRFEHYLAPSRRFILRSTRPRRMAEHQAVALLHRPPALEGKEIGNEIFPWACGADVVPGGKKKKMTKRPPPEPSTATPGQPRLVAERLRCRWWRSSLLELTHPLQARWYSMRRIGA